MNRKEELIKIFSRNIREVLSRVSVDFDKVQEIHLRIGRPLMMVNDNRDFYVNPDGGLGKAAEGGYVVTKEDIRDTVEFMSSYSLYAFEEEIRQGFLTIQGGHRIGIAGKAVADGGEIRTIKYISFINVRLSHQIKGCASPVMPYLYQEGRVCHTLLISPPRCGKTTLLRDVIRQVSDGTGGWEGVNVGVVDERSEIGACCQGAPQNDLGVRTDVLDCCPKARGMMMLIRTMSPQVVAVDEIGSREDLDAIEYVMNCGCKLIATVHGSSLEDIRQKPVMRDLVRERVFERYVILDNLGGAGHVRRICDREGRDLYEAGVGA